MECTSSSIDYTYSDYMNGKPEMMDVCNVRLEVKWNANFQSECFQILESFVGIAFKFPKDEDNFGKRWNW